MDYKNILSELKDQILYVTINRESKLNALNKATLDELADVFSFVATADDVRGVLLTGAGEKSFVAGADIAEFSSFDAKQGRSLAADGHTRVFNVIENCPKPVIAAINGFALGGGLELAMACHIRIASENAKLGLPEVTLGLIPGYGGTQRLTQLIGKSKAAELIITAEMISAAEAEKIGLVSYVVPQEELIEKAESLFNKIKQRAPLAVAAALKSVNAVWAENSTGFDVEIEEFGKCFNTADFKEGSTAFLEKRKAQFTGR